MIPVANNTIVTQNVATTVVVDLDLAVAASGVQVSMRTAPIQAHYTAHPAWA